MERPSWLGTPTSKRVTGQSPGLYTSQVTEGTAGAGWYPVGDGTRLRYWDGEVWTDHFHDVSPGSGGNHQVGKARAVVQQVTSDDHTVPAGTIWSALGKTVGNITTGRYRLDTFYLYYSRGTLRTDAQQVPVHLVVDVDVRQSITQRARDVYTVVAHTRGHGPGPLAITLADIPDGHGAARVITHAAHQARLNLEQRDIQIQGQRHQATNTTRQEMLVQGVIGQVPIQVGSNPSISLTPGAPIETAPTPQALPSQDPVSQLKELAALRDAGVLTEDEFANKKAEILNRI